MTNVECQDCKKIFKLPKSTEKYLETHAKKIIYCPNKNCNSTNMAWVK